MFKVLHIMAGADAGGISMVVLNYYQWLDREKIHFDIAVTTDQIGKNAEQFKKLGANIYRIPLKSNGIKAYKNAIIDLFEKNHYDAIHVHENGTSYVALSVAKRLGVPVRFAHAHTTSACHNLKDILKRLSGCILNSFYATKVIACGQLAGERIFGKYIMKTSKAIVLPNAIDTSKFIFDEEIRCKVRESLGISDNYVIGMVGRLAYPKNHIFALRLLKKYHQIAPDVVLILVGNGEDEEMIKKEIQENDMQDYVKMLGRRDDVEKLYQAFDILIMPSFYEGFPVSAVEAMATGLPVLLSDKITKELDFGKAVRYISINNEEGWISSLEDFRVNTGRSERTLEPRQHGLDIRDTSYKLQNLYLNTDI